MSDEIIDDEMPQWVQGLVAQVEPLLAYHSVGQLDLRWGDEGELFIAPAVFEVESDDETNGQTGFGAYFLENTASLSELLKTEDGKAAPVDCGPEAETGVVVLTVEGRHGTQDVRLQIQFEPFDDAEPTFILDLHDQEGDEDAAGANGHG